MICRTLVSDLASAIGALNDASSLARSRANAIVRRTICSVRSAAAPTTAPVMRSGPHGTAPAAAAAPAGAAPDAPMTAGTPGGGLTAGTGCGVVAGTGCGDAVGAPGGVRGGGPGGVAVGCGCAPLVSPARRGRGRGVVTSGGSCSRGSSSSARRSSISRCLASSSCRRAIRAAVRSLICIAVCAVLNARLSPGMKRPMPARLMNSIDMLAGLSALSSSAICLAISSSRRSSRLRSAAPSRGAGCRGRGGSRWVAGGMSSRGASSLGSRRRGGVSRGMSPLGCGVSRGRGGDVDSAGRNDDGDGCGGGCPTGASGPRAGGCEVPASTNSIIRRAESSTFMCRCNTVVETCH